MASSCSFTYENSDRFRLQFGEMIKQAINEITDSTSLSDKIMAVSLSFLKSKPNISSEDKLWALQLAARISASITKANPQTLTQEFRVQIIAELILLQQNPLTPIAYVEIVLEKAKEYAKKRDVEKVKDLIRHVFPDVKSEVADLVLKAYDECRALYTAEPPLSDEEIEKFIKSSPKDQFGQFIIHWITVSLPSSMENSELFYESWSQAMEELMNEPPSALSVIGTIRTCNEIMKIIKGSSEPISSEHIKLFFTHLVKYELRTYQGWVTYQCLKVGLENPDISKILLDHLTYHAKRYIKIESASPEGPGIIRIKPEVWFGWVGSTHLTPQDTIPEVLLEVLSARIKELVQEARAKSLPIKVVMLGKEKDALPRSAFNQKLLPDVDVPPAFTRPLAIRILDMQVELDQGT